MTMMMMVMMQYSGDTEENILRLCQHAGLSADDKAIIMNMHKLGVPITIEVCLSVISFSVYFCLSFQ